MDINNINKTFYCANCGKNVEAEILRGTNRTDSPVGYIKATTPVANCPECGKKVHNRTLDDINSIILTMAAIAEWRKQNPEGTRKQCRRKLGLKEEIVMAFWEPTEDLEYHVMTPEEIETEWKAAKA